jgi:ADP-ribose pyrophosphatase YjhB (NUDIX family)
MSGSADVALDLRTAARAVIIDDDDDVLLVKFVFPSGIEVWALPGGGLEPDESVTDGLRRELHEELGLTDVDIGPHIWNREHVIPMITGHDGQRDHIHLVRTSHFEPEPVIGWERMRAEFVFDMRWWSRDEIERATDKIFSPTRLGALYGQLLHDGPPPVPIDTGV